jgi:hypothetical protein
VQAAVKDFRPLLRTIFLDAGYDGGDLIADWAQRGIEVLASLSKPVSKTTTQDRHDRAACLALPAGKARYPQRGCSIEPFFATSRISFRATHCPYKAKPKLQPLFCSRSNLFAAIWEP